MSKRDFDYVYRPKRYLDVIEPKWLEDTLSDDEIDIPIKALINPKYLQNRAKERFKPHEKPNHGDPSIVMNSLEKLPSWGNDKTEESSGTTHLSIIDQDGNAVSMTATIESAFGSHRWSSGFLLNNEMTDFSRDVPKDGSRVANAVAPNRRPRSSMSPTMVFDNKNNLLMIIVNLFQNF